MFILLWSFSIHFSRMLCDSTPGFVRRSVCPSVGPSVSLFHLLGLLCSFYHEHFRYFLVACYATQHLALSVGRSVHLLVHLLVCFIFLDYCVHSKAIILNIFWSHVTRLWLCPLVGLSICWFICRSVSSSWITVFILPRTFQILFSRMLRDSTLGFVCPSIRPSVRPSVGLFYLLGLLCSFYREHFQTF